MSQSPDQNQPEWKTTSELRALGEALQRISRMLHDHTRKLEVAVEGTYAGESSDPRVRLLSDSLSVARTADLQLSRLNQSGQRVLATIREQLAQVRETQEFLRQASTQLPPIGQTPYAATPTPSGGIKNPTEALNRSINNLKRDELETLYEIARTLNSSLVFDEVLRKVMDQVIRVVDAERGFLVLLDPATNELTFPIARDKQERTIDPGEFNFSRTTVERVVRTKQPVLTDDAQVEMKEQQSIVAYGIRSIICAPLVVRGSSIGAVYVDSRINANLFGPRHRDLLYAFCHQAAIAIHNARLFDDLNRAIRQVEEDKQYMDNIFASIANGVITTDHSGIITTFNAAAGLILRINPLSAIGKHYRDVFQSIPQVGLTKILQNVPAEHNHGTIVPATVDCEIDGRTGVVNLTLYASSLRDANDTPIGMALVIDDRTEVKRMEADKKRAEASAKEIRRIFGRFVHPNVVEQLINNPAALNLGGESKEISVIKADIRSFTRLSEQMPSREVMNLLNSLWEIMVNAIWDEGGTVTGFWGDELMAIFNAPLLQEDHALRAVRAAWKMRVAVQKYQQDQPQEIPIAFGFGVNTGLGVVGNLGSQGRLQNYTAIGDAVNVAARLQQNTLDNNILLNHSTFLQVRQHVLASRLPPMHVKNKTVPLNVWSLLCIVES